MRSLRILGVETSCDETAAAVVSDAGDATHPWVVESSVIASQTEIHRAWGGAVPELASRQHVRDICGVVERALADAGAVWGDLGAVALLGNGERVGQRPLGGGARPVQFDGQPVVGLRVGQRLGVSGRGVDSLR